MTKELRYKYVIDGQKIGGKEYPHYAAVRIEPADSDLWGWIKHSEPSIEQPRMMDLVLRPDERGPGTHPHVHGCSTCLASADAERASMQERSMPEHTLEPCGCVDREENVVCEYEGKNYLMLWFDKDGIKYAHPGDILFHNVYLKAVST